VSDGPTRFDEYAIGHARSRWTLLGEAAGGLAVGWRRIEVPPAAFSTPVHDHGCGEEIF
jgi:uncharacterized cupin superfamily protein